MNSRHPHPASALLDEDALPVRDKAHILKLLRDLQEHKTLVTVALPDTNDLYNSAVLEVDAAAGTLTLDELTPAPGHQRLLRERELMVFARLSGLSLRFETELMEAGEQDGIALYRLALPEVLYHGQKRSHYRVRLGLGLRVPVILAHDESHSINGELRDLSIGGLGAAFPLDTPIAEGERIYSCWVDLPGGGTLSCTLEVRHVSRDPERGELRIGARFVELNPAQERMLQRCVYHLEREHLRRQARRDR